MGADSLGLSLWPPSGRRDMDSAGQKYYLVHEHRFSIAVYAPVVVVYLDAAGSLLGDDLFRSWDDSPMLKTSNTEGTDSRSVECSLMTLTRSPNRFCDDNPGGET